MKKIFLLVLISFIFLSCREESVIDNSEIYQKFLIATDANVSDLIYYDYMEGVTSNDIFSEVNGSKLPGKVTQIREWGSLIFLIIPEAYIIEIIKKDNFESVSSIDFSEDQKKPVDICFVENSSDSYIILSNDSSVVQYDLYNFEISKYINIYSKPSSISSLLQFVYIVSTESNSVSILDSRTDEVVKNIELPTAPMYSSVSKELNKCAIVSLGDGKLNENSKSAAKLTIIDNESKTISSILEIGTSKTNPVELYPTGIVISTNDYAFISSMENVLRVNIDRESGINTIKNDYYTMMTYFPLRNKVIILDLFNEIIVANSLSLRTEYSFKINKSVVSVHAL